MKARSTCFLLGFSLVVLSVALPASGQQSSSTSAEQTTQASAAVPATPQDQTAAASTPAPASPTWSIGPIDFAGAIDGYYSWNSNHPDDKVNFLYNFNQPTNTFSLSLVKLKMSHMADPVGFDVDLMYGQTATQVSSVSTDTGFDKFVQQAYVSFAPKRAKGFEIDFGKFVTSAGAEVIESYSNWNYSRSLLFAWAIPYYHFGLRTSWPMGKHLTGGFQLVNGWNNTISANSRATIGANVGVTYAKWSLVENYYGGPVNPVKQGWRHLFDTVLTLTPSSKFSMYLNYDWAENRNFGNSFSFGLPDESSVTAFPNGSLVKWQGVATALHFQPTSKWAFTPRIEWFDDPQGFAMDGADFFPFVPGNLPVRQQVKEFTITGEYKLLEGLMWRAEYRHDWSNQPFFERGTPLCSGVTIATCPQGFGLQNSKTQNTVTIAFIGYFGPKR